MSTLDARPPIAALPDSPLLQVGRLRLGLFRFTLIPLEPMQVSALNKGNMLRGAFGLEFRRLCCVPECRDAHHCPLRQSCPYKSIFEPSPPEGAERLSANADIPRPFVFRPPLSEKTLYRVGEAFEFELVLIGSALESLPYFVLAFRELASQGLGPRRAKCRLETVEELGIGHDASHCSKPTSVKSNSKSELHDAPGQPHDSAHAKTPSPNSKAVYSSSDQTFRSYSGFDLAIWIEHRLAALCGESGEPPQRIAIHFLTPTLLKANGQWIERPEFHHIVKRSRDRVNALCTFFGSGPIEADFAGLGKRSETMKIVSCDVRWLERHRTSSRTGETQALSGFIGAATYEGDLGDFLPWMAAGQLLHLGKHAAWGCGEIVLSSGENATRT